MVLWSVLMVSQVASAQTLEKMIWFNEPEHWSIDDGALEMIVPAQIIGEYRIMDSLWMTLRFIMLLMVESLRQK